MKSKKKLKHADVLVEIAPSNENDANIANTKVPKSRKRKAKEMVQEAIILATESKKRKKKKNNEPEEVLNEVKIENTEETLSNSKRRSSNRLNDELSNLVTLDTSLGKSKKKKLIKENSFSEQIEIEPVLVKSKKTMIKKEETEKDNDDTVDISVEVIDEPTKKKKKKKKDKNELLQDTIEIIEEIIVESSSQKLGKKSKRKKKSNETSVENEIMVVDCPIPKKVKKSKRLEKFNEDVPNEEESVEIDEIVDLNLDKRSKRQKKIKEDQLIKEEIKSEEIIEEPITSNKKRAGRRKKSEEKSPLQVNYSSLKQTKKNKNSVQEIVDYQPERKSKKKNKINLTVKRDPEVLSDESSGDEITVCKSRSQKILDSSDESENEGNVQKPEIKEEKVEVATPRRFKRCLDSSDEDCTPKLERLKKLKMLASKVKEKRGRSLCFLDDEAGDEGSSDEIDEDELPMFEHEEDPPDSEDERDKLRNAEEVEEEEESDLGEEEEEEEEGSDEEDEEDEEDEGDETDVSEDGDDDEEFINPYHDVREKDEDLMQVFSNSIKMLSKNTAMDKQNTKRYKKEIGKYQLAVQSTRNKAAQMDEKLRYKRNMKVARFDRGLKEMRNLDIKDDEFHNTQEVSLYGQRVQIYPHSKKRSKFPGNCELEGCRRGFQVDTSKIVGAKIFDPFNLDFMKKKKAFNNEAFYWICRGHMIEDATSDSDEYTSDES